MRCVNMEHAVCEYSPCGMGVLHAVPGRALAQTLFAKTFHVPFSLRFIGFTCALTSAGVATNQTSCFRQKSPTLYTFPSSRLSLPFFSPHPQSCHPQPCLTSTHGVPKSSHRMASSKMAATRSRPWRSSSTWATKSVPRKLPTP